MKIQFLGAAGTVTGSRYLLRHGHTSVLIDCGLFQGVKNLRLRNWQPLPFPAEKIDAVVLTHAHLDHSGYLPRLIREGFKGPIYCTRATEALAKILLPDSGRLQEEDAQRANKHGYTKHHPAEPLYTAEEAENSLKYFKTQPYHHSFAIGDIRVRFSPAGHILGSSCVQIEAAGKTITFSGDLGRQNDFVMKAPEPIHNTDFLVIESTYGNRLHPTDDPRTRLKEIVTKTAARGGVIMIPAFAVGRAQELLHLLTQLRAANEIPNIPFFLDSPMAIDATDVFCHYGSEHRLSRDECQALSSGVTYVRDRDDSKRLSAKTTPKIIIAGAGMMTGGRILHHLRAFGSDHRNTLIISGYQAEGTRGYTLLNGATTLKIFGQDIAIRCHIEQMMELSAHADYNEICQWLTHFENPPQKVFITHGEIVAADSLRQKLEARFGWDAIVPETAQEFALF